MAIHLTPTELGRSTGTDEEEVIARCIELGVPIFHGKIDKTLYLYSVREADAEAAGDQAARAAEA